VVATGRDLGAQAPANDIRSFATSALVWLTRLCGASFLIAVATFPIIKAAGDPKLLLIGYAAVVLAVAVSLALLRFRVVEAITALFGRASLVRALLFLFALALALRLGAFLLLAIEPVGDPASHELAMWNIAQGVGYVRQNGPDAHWPPGYAFFGSIFYVLFGRDWHILVLVNCVLDASTAVLVYFVARPLLTPPQARIAGLIYALNPTMIVLSQTLVYTTLLGFLFCIALFIRSRPVALGIHLGFMALVKPIAVPLVAIFAIDQFLSGVGWKKVFVTAGLVLAVAVATVSPWTIRNYLVFDRFVPVSANGGWVLWWGNNDSSKGLMQDWSQEQKRATGAELIDLDRRLMHEALAWIADNPLQFLNLVPIKQANTWGTEVATLPDLRQIGPLGEQAARGIAQTWYLVLILLSGLAMIRQTRFLFSGARGRLICMMIMLIWAIHSVYIGWSIYRVFVLPFLSVLAVVALAAEMRRRTDALDAGPGLR
jgi:hypothetical protein